jgi:hypothetical protein
MDRRVAEVVARGGLPSQPDVSRDRRERSNLELRTALAFFLLLTSGCYKSPEANLRKRLATQLTGTINLPPGVVEVSSEFQLAPGAHDLDIVGSGTLLKATDEFKGRAVLVAEGSRNIRLRDFSLDGNRIVLTRAVDAPAPENALRDSFLNNGILLDRVEGAEVSNLTLANIANLPILISRSSKIRMHHLRVEDSGSLDSRTHSNGSGGVVLENGASDFEIRASIFRRIRGNAVWAYSPRGAPAVVNGAIIANRFDAIGRDAILIWNAAAMRVEENTGSRIGYPAENVDPLAQPAAIATLGDVDHSTYTRNQFEEVDGQCIGLDGFHDGSVTKNQCADRRPPAEYPFGHFGIVMNNTQAQAANIEITENVIDGMKYGGVFVIGTGHRIAKNRFEHLNKAECDEGDKKPGCSYLKDEPKMLSSGIYLGRGGSRPALARTNTIRDNIISGYKMKSRCISAAPGVSIQANTLNGNQCSDYSLAP